MDVYEGIQSEILSITIFDENSDLSTTYLGKVDRFKNNKIKYPKTTKLKPKSPSLYQNKGTLWETVG